MSTCRRVVALAVVLALAAPGPAPAAPSSRALVAQQVSCAACFLVDDAGTTLFARRAAAMRPNASTTKMATALVVVRAAPLDEIVTVSGHAAATPGGGVDLAAGGRYRVAELLSALLLASANDAAVALAEHVAGSEGAFVARMNELADGLGLRHTRFVNPHGLDADGHGSSARDLARLAEELLGDPVLAALAVAPEATIADVDGGGVRGFSNRNVLLESYRGAIGVKTGFTARAGQVLVAAARRRGRRLIAVVMGSDDAPADARALLDAGFARLRRSVLLAAQAPVSTLVFDPSGATAVVASGAVRGMDPPDSVQVLFSPRPGLAPPLDAGDVVGTVTVMGRSGVVGEVDAVTADPVARSHAYESVAARLLTGLLRAGHGLAQAVAG